jgi:anti-sigma factor RsiW
LEININISNYEEYLLSAVDGELSGDEMVALEAFLQQHPHIREELALLESLRLTPDNTLSFDDKAQLYRQTTVLSAANYESQLLDYIDNELHGPEKQALESLIQQHPHIRQELNILKQARLQPDLSLRFGDKTVLYRNNRTKVRPIWWWSAAAAVVAGVAVILFAPSSQPDSHKSIQVAVNQPAVKKNAPVAAPPVASNTPIADESTVVTTTPKAREAVVTPKQKTGDALAANTPASAPETGPAGNNFTGSCAAIAG